MACRVAAHTEIARSCNSLRPFLVHAVTPGFAQVNKSTFSGKPSCF
jgi:hypothetical protein